MTENNDNRNTITYDDDWKSVSYSEYPKVSEELDSDEEDVNSLSAENSDEKKNSPKQLVITIQLVCCILIALAAFLLNLFGGEVYAATRCNPILLPITHRWQRLPPHLQGLFSSNKGT